ncbi:MAG TPA: sigma-54 dependent transcriptional regulator, partial [Blastocatellia bacterium]|nr:sigma-54 dependent transcriptional regulator [Blastocatellia bacterium]
EELRSELSARYGFNEIVGISPRLQAVFHTMMKVARVDATVLIHGESGTGKELIARALHRHSHRAQGPFVPVNCGAIPHSLFEAEFFGHERGAFTDAKERRPGHFELAHGGTLFLDEVGELPLESQVKLLRALQSREVTRLGGRQPVKFDVRVIAATNIGLNAAVEQGKFRKDLYWRLNVVKLVLPSLRERREDIPLLIDHLLERFARELGLKVMQVTSDTRQLLSLYDWPGNVRELENTLCSAMIMCDGNEITINDLPARIRGEVSEEPDSALGGDSTAHRPTLADTVKEAIHRVEKMAIISKLSEMKGSRTATAEALGISRKSLFNKMRQYGLSNPEADHPSDELHD